MIKKEDINESHIEKAYELLNNYCKENNKDLLVFVNDKNNIKLASEEIHQRLNFALKLILKPKKIEALINNNHDWIVEKAHEYHK